MTIMPVVAQVVASYKGVRLIVQVAAPALVELGYVSNTGPPSNRSCHICRIKKPLIRYAL